MGLNYTKKSLKPGLTNVLISLQVMKPQPLRAVPPRSLSKVSPPLLPVGSKWRGASPHGHRFSFCPLFPSGKSSFLSPPLLHPPIYRKNNHRPVITNIHCTSERVLRPQTAAATAVAPPQHGNYYPLRPISDRPCANKRFITSIARRWLRVFISLSLFGDCC